jgi:hypothetical protein
MNQLKSRLLRQQELSRHPYEEIKQNAPKAIYDATSAHEIGFSNPPQYIYQKPNRYKMQEEYVNFKQDQKLTTFRKILDGI